MIARASSGGAVDKRCERRIAGQAVFQITHLERVGRIADDLAQVVDVGAVGQHVGNLESLAAFGVRVARHHDGDTAAAEVIGSRPAVSHAFDLSRRVAQRNELLQQLGIGVLDVVQVQHHVVAHLQGEIQSLDFFAGRRVRCLGRIERRDAVTDRRAVDLHEDDAQADWRCIPSASSCRNRAAKSAATDPSGRSVCPRRPHPFAWPGCRRSAAGRLRRAIGCERSWSARAA